MTRRKGAEGPTIHCRRALVDGRFVDDVRIEVDADGRIAALTRGLSASSPLFLHPDANLQLGVVVPGFANTHSHLFHRALRGATGGDDFWSWRQAMYRIAGRLEPDLYRRLAAAVFSEMVAAGYTSVAEFHYLHHRPDGRPYPHHDMEMAVAAGAAEAGIRLTLLDTCYLHSGLGDGSGTPLTPEQARFGDGSAAAWLERWYRLRDALAREYPQCKLGAAVHSVRALTPAEIAEAVAGLPDDVPLHVHVSEQPRENADCLAATGLTPTGVLAQAEALSGRTSVVHATHLTDEDIALIAGSGTTVSLCPTTEADLGDGIARVADLAEAGVPLTIGTDEDVVTDPFAELRLLESTARLAGGRRGVLDAAALWRAGAGRAQGDPGLRVGDAADLVEIDTSSARLAGTDPLTWPLTASADDVARVVVGGVLAPRADAAGLRAVLAEIGES